MTATLYTAQHAEFVHIQTHKQALHAGLQFFAAIGSLASAHKGLERFGVHLFGEQRRKVKVSKYFKQMNAQNRISDMHAKLLLVANDKIATSGDTEL